MADFYLVDDGTMDTVIRCGKCGGEARFNYDPAGADMECPEDNEDGSTDENTMLSLYDAFVDSCIKDMESDHECEQLMTDSIHVYGVGSTFKIHPTSGWFMRGVKYATVTAVGRKWIHLTANVQGVKFTILKSNVNSHVESVIEGNK